MELAESKNAVQHEEEKQMLVSIQTLPSRFDAFRTIRPKEKATQKGYWICTNNSITYIELFGKSNTKRVLDLYK